MTKRALAAWLACTPLWAIAQAPLPTDVARFVERRDQCDHFRGEEAYDAARRTSIEKGVRLYCRGTDAQLQRLRAKYRKQPAVMDRLQAYEPHIEG